MKEQLDKEEGSSKRSRGGLFRRFIVPQLMITAVAAGISLLSAGHAQRGLERERLVAVVSSNVRITNELGYPRSAQLASKLSAISGETIIFSGTQGELVSPVELDEGALAAARLAVAQSPEAIELKDFNAAAGSLENSGESLVILQKEKSLWALATGNTALWPLFGGLFLAISSAFLISRAIVRPLKEIVTHLEIDSPDDTLAIPSSLKNRSDEIGTLARSLVQSREALHEEQEKRRRMQHLALLGELTTSLAHEIKNPASAILMHAQALEKFEEDSTGTLIKEESERIVSLVNQWLFVAKPEAPRMVSNDLSALLSRLSEKLKALLEFHSVSLELDCPESLMLQCDSQRIEHLFRNLIDNAIQAMPSGGKIGVTLSREEPNRICFEVRDEGRGFSDEALAHFGEAFYSEREGGMGLGLALVAGVTKAHGGEVNAQNIPSGGAAVKGFFLIQPSEI